MEPILKRAKSLTAERIRPGDAVVDATLGNGHDAVHLARAVGAGGRLFGFDVQAEAVARSRRRLEKQGLADRAELFETGHQDLGDALPEALRGRLAAAMFNLGYLPGSDHAVITEPETTVAALEQAVDWLRTGGIATVVLYRGHEGGEREYQAVRSWAAERPQKRLRVLHYHFLNQQEKPPELIAIGKRG